MHQTLVSNTLSGVTAGQYRSSPTVSTESSLISWKSLTPHVIPGPRGLTYPHSSYFMSTVFKNTIPNGPYPTVSRQWDTTSQRLSPQHVDPLTASCRPQTLNTRRLLQTSGKKLQQTKYFCSSLKYLCKTTILYFK